MIPTHAFKEVRHPWGHRQAWRIKRPSFGETASREDRAQKILSSGNACRPKEEPTWSFCRDRLWIQSTEVSLGVCVPALYFSSTCANEEDVLP